jgi:hypothetical protein
VTRAKLMTPTEYEKAALERFRTLFPSPHFFVKHNVRIFGNKSRRRRQIDIAVFDAGKSKPFLIAEAKRQKRPIDVGKAGITIALVQDVGNIPTVMVATSSFSVAAENHLAAEGIETLIITLKDAHALRWIPFIEQNFQVDHAFREVTGHLVEALRNNEAKDFLYTDIPYEEWLAVVNFGLSRFSKSTGYVLLSLAREHLDSGVRFNAVQLLDEAGQLKTSDIKKLLFTETDPEVIELLREFMN